MRALLVVLIPCVILLTWASKCNRGDNGIQFKEIYTALIFLELKYIKHIVEAVSFQVYALEGEKHLAVQVRYRTVPYGTVRYCTVMYSWLLGYTGTLQYGTLLTFVLRYRTVRYVGTVPVRYMYGTVAQAHRKRYRTVPVPVRYVAVRYGFE